ncbi:hypothetical protein [Halanaerobium sp. ST460_2HS_T2]|nr:hypothetical protein [Halanaerobium sp. ST460_2HS_T2]
MTFFLQLSYYLIKDYNSGAATEIENSEDENGQLNSESELNDQGETATDSEAGQEFAESAVENEFDNQEFSAFNPEEFDYQQDNN